MGRVSSRPNPPAIHMIVAMVVVLVPALLAVAWFQRLPAPTVTPVDAAPLVKEARAVSPYEVAVPSSVPDGWVCTRARWVSAGKPGLGGTPSPGDAWSLGYMTPQQMYIGLDQTDAQPDALVGSVTGNGHEDGTLQVAGRTWTRFEGNDGRTHALVLRQGDRVTVVSGDVPYDALAAFANTLTFSRG